MTARHQVSRAALELIKRFEGYRRRAARLADGRWTIGYGHTLTAREGAEVSEDDAEALLLYDIRPVVAAVNELTYTPLTQNQFDALTAFAFNVGVDEFRRSAVLRRVNEGALIEAAGALEMWRKADFEGERIVVDALVRRRAAEKALFLTPADGWIPAPSPILRPRVDYEAGDFLPRSAVALETPLTGEVAEARRTPVETAPASLAAADAVSQRLNEILPEPIGADLPEVSVEPVEDAVEPPAPVAEPPLEAAPEALHPATLFGAVFGRRIESEAPESTTAGPSHPEPVPEPAPSETAPAWSSDGHFEFPERQAAADLTRRVVWREAPMETDADRLLGGRFSRFSPVLLIALFLAGIAVFAAGIVWGWSTRGSGLVSWILGVVGIICVAGSVYVYLERLGERED